MQGKRATDGLTLNKIMMTVTAVSISTAMGLGTYEYNKNLDITDEKISRIEKNTEELHEDLEAIAKNMHDLATNQKIDYANTTNQAAQLIKNTKDIEEIKRYMYRRPSVQ